MADAITVPRQPVENYTNEGDMTYVRSITVPVSQLPLPLVVVLLLMGNMRV